jgi:hypothetical protein
MANQECTLTLIPSSVPKVLVNQSLVVLLKVQEGWFITDKSESRMSNAIWIVMHLP